MSCKSERPNRLMSSLRPVQPTLSSVSRVVTHDVPVDVIPRRLWHEFKEPSMPDFDVSDITMKCNTRPNTTKQTVETLSHFTLVGQYLPASSEDNEERRGQNEEPLQLPGRTTFLQTYSSGLVQFRAFSSLKKLIQLNTCIYFKAPFR